MNKKQFFEIPDGMNVREWWGFHWLEHVMAIPAPLVFVTGYKENGYLYNVHSPFNPETGKSDNTTVAVLKTLDT